MCYSNMLSMHIFLYLAHVLLLLFLIHTVSSQFTCSQMIGDGNKNDLAVAFSVSDIKNTYKVLSSSPQIKA